MNATDGGAVQVSDLQADAIVIGTGAAGLCAALTLGSGGASVLVFEQMNEVGGMTNHAEGMFAVESRMQKKANVGLTVDEIFHAHMAETHWRADAPLVKKFMERSGSNIDWLESQGVRFAGLYNISAFSPRVWHQFVDFGQEGFVKPLYQRLRQMANVRVFLETPVQKLEMEDEQVVGVTVKTKTGETVVASAKVVVIASGGWQDNKDWVERYGRSRNIRPVAPSQMTGGPIQMAWDAGADESGLGLVQTVVVVPDEDTNSQLMQAGYQPRLFVNRDGRRYCDESMVWKFPFAGNALINQPDALAWCIFDEPTKEALKQPNSLLYALGAFFDILNPLPDIDGEIERGMRERKAFRTDSLERLAVMMGAEADDFLPTVEEYNSCCDAGYDSVFGKDRRYLQEIRTPPFYAIKLGPAAFIAMGGIRTNARMEVLTKDYLPIEGLYTAGCCAGGYLGGSCEISTTGGSCGFAVFTGRTAGEAALEYLGMM